MTLGRGTLPEIVLEICQRNQIASGQDLESQCRMVEDMK